MRGRKGLACSGWKRVFTSMKLSVCMNGWASIRFPRSETTNPTPIVCSTRNHLRDLKKSNAISVGYGILIIFDLHGQYAFNRKKIDHGEASFSTWLEVVSRCSIWHVHSLGSVLYSCAAG